MPAGHSGYLGPGFIGPVGATGAAATTSVSGATAIVGEEAVRLYSSRPDPNYHPDQVLSVAPFPNHIAQAIVNHSPGDVLAAPLLAAAACLCLGACVCSRTELRRYRRA